MAGFDKDWVKGQLDKAVSAEQGIIKAEKDHRGEIKDAQVQGVYDRIIADDEKHLDGLKKVGQKYGLESTGTAEAGGGLLGSVKAAMEGMTMTADPFQAIGNDLMMKSNAVNYDRAWVQIFQDIGDPESAAALEQAAVEDEEHEALMRNTLTNVGIREAHGEKFGGK